MVFSQNLGAGESGKSTVLKQMKLIYAQGFSKSEKLEWKPVVFNNVVQSFQLILEAMNEMDIGFENPENEVRQFTKPPAHAPGLPPLFDMPTIRSLAVTYFWWPRFEESPSMSRQASVLAVHACEPGRNHYSPA